jgi:hypothetical protein
MKFVDIFFCFGMIIFVIGICKLLYDACMSIKYRCNCMPIKYRCNCTHDFLTDVKKYGDRVYIFYTKPCWRCLSAKWIIINERRDYENER